MKSENNNENSTRSTYVRVKRAKLYQEVSDQIKRQIITRQLKPGDRLPTERELANEFGVSRTVVREAIKSLSQEGLIDAQAGRGTFVIDNTSQVMRDSMDLMLKIAHHGDLKALVEVREIIEPEVAALAANRATDEHIKQLKQTLEIMEKSASDEAEAFLAADHQFHITLAEAADNPFIKALLDPLMLVLEEQRHQTYALKQGPGSAISYHHKIFDAIKKNDPTGARQAMQKHIEQVKDAVQKIENQK